MPNKTLILYHAFFRYADDRIEEEAQNLATLTQSLAIWGFLTWVLVRKVRKVRACHARQCLDLMCGRCQSPDNRQLPAGTGKHQTTQHYTGIPALTFIPNPTQRPKHLMAQQLGASYSSQNLRASAAYPPRRLPHSASSVSLLLPQSASYHSFGHGSRVRSSGTWTTSSGELGLLSNADEVDDRDVFVQEYNRLAKKVS